MGTFSRVNSTKAPLGVVKRRAPFGLALGVGTGPKTVERVVKSVQAQWQKRQRITPVARDGGSQSVQPLQGLHFADCAAWCCNGSLYGRQRLKALATFCWNKQGADFAGYRMHCQPLVQAVRIGGGA